MTGHAIRRAIAVLAVVCIGGGWLAACGDDDDTSSDNTEDTSGSDSTDEVSADPLRFCFQGSKDVALVNLLEALDQMTDMGYEIEQPFVAETELCTDGVLRGEFDFGSASTPVFAAVANGADNIAIVGNRNMNTQVIVSQAGIEECDQLDGKTYGIHSPGSVMRAVAQYWIGEECDETPKINEVVIEGSGNRTQALIDGQIDATGVETQDLATLEREYAGKYFVLAPLYEQMPELVDSAIYVNTDYADKNHEAVVTLLSLLTEIAREWDEDPQAYEDAIIKHLPDIDPDLADYFANDLGAGILFPLNGGVTEDSIAFTLDFFKDSYEGDLEPDDVADLSYLEEALDELGVELSAGNE